MTRYLDLDTVLAINLENGGPGAGVREREGVEAAIGRPYSSGFGQDLFPTLWDKAAVYLHGLSSTQYFHDGNKRTAWLVAVTFLELNGIVIRNVPDVEAEAFVLCVAKELFTNEDEPDRTIEMAAEWFRTRHETQRRGVVSDYRVEYAYLTQRSTLQDGVVLRAEGGGITSIAIPMYPASFPLQLIARVHWGKAEIENPPTLRATMVVTSGVFAGQVAAQVKIAPGEFVPGGHKHHSTGWM
ncbi:MAG: Fic family protein, partial [Rhodococcus sp. (in: high G+C Gram-positive bacteria)]